MNALDRLRQRIDALDEQLVRLLSARAECALEIGRVKKEAGLPVYQPARETEVLAHVQAINPGPLDDGAIRRLFERVIDEARRLERLADERARRETGNGRDASAGGRQSRNAGRRRAGSTDPGQD